MITKYICLYKGGGGAIFFHLKIAGSRGIMSGETINKKSSRLMVDGAFVSRG